MTKKPIPEIEETKAAQRLEQMAIELGNEYKNRIPPNHVHMLISLCVFMAELPIIEIIASGKSPEILASFTSMCRGTLLHMQEQGFDWKKIAEEVRDRHGFGDSNDPLSKYLEDMLKKFEGGTPQ